jgi:hypothetical protein
MDTFTKAYIECALWASNDDNGDPLDSVCSQDDICPATLQEMINDCQAFQRDNTTDLETGTPECAGHDFWLTRNHHGAGFWDGNWDKQIGQRLTDAAHAYGEYNLYIGDDGKIYGGG